MFDVLERSLLAPLRALRWRYAPLLLIYFSYGASGFSNIALSFWEKEELALSATQFLTISAWLMLPWTLKMIVGQLVDTVSIFGSRRRSYIVLGAFFLILGALLLVGLASKNALLLSFASPFTLYLLSNLCTVIGFVIQDVTADTMTTEVVDRSGKTPEEVQREVTMVQILGRLALAFAIFATAGLGGYLADNFSYVNIFWATLFIPFLSLGGLFFLRLEQEKGGKKARLDIRILGGGIALGVISLLFAFSDITLAQEFSFLLSLVFLSGMLLILLRDIDPSHKKILLMSMAALFFYRATPSVGPGLSWWEIDVLHFDPAFFGVLAQIGATVALITLWFLADFIARYPIRSVLILLIFLEAIMSIPELILYFGIHETMGIDARTIALFDTALGSPLVHISMVLVLSLLAFYAPVGHRGTWFALGASFMNLALMGGTLLTKYLNNIFLVTREVRDETGNILVSADYTELGSLLITAISLSFILPLAAVLFFLPRLKKKG